MTFPNIPLACVSQASCVEPSFRLRNWNLIVKRRTDYVFWRRQIFHELPIVPLERRLCGRSSGTSTALRYNHSSKYISTHLFRTCSICARTELGKYQHYRYRPADSYVHCGKVTQAWNGLPVGRRTGIYFYKLKLRGISNCVHERDESAQTCGKESEFFAAATKSKEAKCATSYHALIEALESLNTNFRAGRFLENKQHRLLNCMSCSSEVSHRNNGNENIASEVDLEQATAFWVKERPLRAPFLLEKYARACSTNLSALKLLRLICKSFQSFSESTCSTPSCRGRVVELCALKGNIESSGEKILNDILPVGLVEGESKSSQFLSSRELSCLMASLGCIYNRAAKESAETALNYMNVLNCGFHFLESIFYVIMARQMVGNGTTDESATLHSAVAANRCLNQLTKFIFPVSYVRIQDNLTARDISLILAACIHLRRLPPADFLRMSLRWLYTMEARPSAQYLSQCTSSLTKILILSGNILRMPRFVDRTENTKSVEFPKPVCFDCEGRRRAKDILSNNMLPDWILLWKLVVRSSMLLKDWNNKDLVAVLRSIPVLSVHVNTGYNACERISASGLNIYGKLIHLHESDESFRVASCFLEELIGRTRRMNPETVAVCCATIYPLLKYPGKNHWDLKTVFQNIMAEKCIMTNPIFSEGEGMPETVSKTRDTESNTACSSKRFVHLYELFFTEVGRFIATWPEDYSPRVLACVLDSLCEAVHSIESQNGVNTTLFSQYTPRNKIENNSHLWRCMTDLIPVVVDRMATQKQSFNEFVSTKAMNQFGLLYRLRRDISGRDLMAVIRFARLILERRNHVNLFESGLRGIFKDAKGAANLDIEIIMNAVRLGVACGGTIFGSLHVRRNVEAKSSLNFQYSWRDISSAASQLRSMGCLQPEYFLKLTKFLSGIPSCDMANISAVDLCNLLHALVPFSQDENFGRVPFIVPLHQHKTLGHFESIVAPIQGDDTVDEGTVATASCILVRKVLPIVLPKASCRSLASIMSWVGQGYQKNLKAVSSQAPVLLLKAGKEIYQAPKVHAGGLSSLERSVGMLDVPKCVATFPANLPCMNSTTSRGILDSATSYVLARLMTYSKIWAGSVDFKRNYNILGPNKMYDQRLNKMNKNDIFVSTSTVDLTERSCVDRRSYVTILMALARIPHMEIMRFKTFATSSSDKDPAWVKLLLNLLHPQLIEDFLSEFSIQDIADCLWAIKHLPLVSESYLLAISIQKEDISGRDVFHYSVNKSSVTFGNKLVTLKKDVLNVFMMKMNPRFISNLLLQADNYVDNDVNDGFKYVGFRCIPLLESLARCFYTLVSMGKADVNLFQYNEPLVRMLAFQRKLGLVMEASPDCNNANALLGLIGTVALILKSIRAFPGELRHEKQRLGVKCLDSLPINQLSRQGLTDHMICSRLSSKTHLQQSIETIFSSAAALSVRIEGILIPLFTTYLRLYPSEADTNAAQGLARICFSLHILDLGRHLERTSAISHLQKFTALFRVKDKPMRTKDAIDRCHIFRFYVQLFWSCITLMCQNTGEAWSEPIPAVRRILIQKGQNLLTEISKMKINHNDIRVDSYYNALLHSTRLATRCFLLAIFEDSYAPSFDLVRVLHHIFTCTEQKDFSEWEHGDMSEFGRNPALCEFLDEGNSQLWEDARGRKQGGSSYLHSEVCYVLERMRGGNRELAGNELFIHREVSVENLFSVDIVLNFNL